MKNNLKKSLCIILALATLTSVLFAGSVFAYAGGDATSGWCGDKAKYSYDSATETLKIEGKGTLYSYAFGDYDNKNNVKNIIIGEGITGINSECFPNFDGITEIKLPNSLRYIDDVAFIDCDNLKAVTIPDSVNYIGFNVFSRTAITVDDSNWQDHMLYVDNCLIQLDSEYLKYEQSCEIKVKDGTRLIAGNAFCNSNKITAVTLPDSLKHIGNSVFYNTSIKTITIPAGVESIDYSAFNYTQKLKTVNYLGTKAEAEKIAITGDCGAVKNKHFKNLFDKKVKIKYIKPTAPKSLSVKSAKKALSIKWKKQTGVTGYQLQYARNNKFTKNKKNVNIKNAKTVSKTVKKLKSKKAYYVRIRSYKTFNGKKYYSDWSKAKKIKTK